MTQKCIVIILKVARLFWEPAWYITEIVLSSIFEMWNYKGIYGAQIQPSNNSRRLGSISLIPANSFLKCKYFWIYIKKWMESESTTKSKLS